MDYRLALIWVFISVSTAFVADIGKYRGNLIIYGLHPNSDATDPDLGFLKSIEEISGFLIIMNSSVREIPLSGLKVIRGYGGGYKIHEDLQPASLLIRHNYDSKRYLHKIDFTQLRAITNGDVYMFDNPAGCSIISGLAFDNLFVNPGGQLFHNSIGLDSNPVDSSLAESCLPTTVPYRGRCKKHNCDWCFETESEEYCCHPACLGGCTGPTDSDCFACKNFRDGEKCEDSCPQPVTIQNYQLTLNVNFKYEFNGFCVSDCPKTLMAEGSRCVRECTHGLYYASGRFCIPCGENCPKTVKSTGFDLTRNDRKVCYVGDSSLDAITLANIENCTTLSGNLIISEESYGSELDGKYPIKTSDELWALHSLREVTGFVYLDLRRHPVPLKNLTFLENLRKIGGEQFHLSLVVLHGGIEFAGLHQLQESPHGNISFIESPNLCYVQTIDTKAIRSHYLDPNFEIQLHNLSTAAECRARGALCHPSCDQAFGCWGPRREDCIRCRSHSVEDTVCVNSCTELPGFYEPLKEDTPSERTMTSLSNPLTERLQAARFAAGHIMDEVSGKKPADAKASITCARCHPECAQTCTGPGSDQCIGPCKHAKFENECLPECPQNTFLDSIKQTCTPCAIQCHQRSLSRKPVCTGTGIYPGPGGCNKCEMFLEFISFDGLLKENSVRTQQGALLCMKGACPMGTFKAIEAKRESMLSRFVAPATVYVGLAMDIVFFGLPTPPLVVWSAKDSGTKISALKNALKVREKFPFDLTSFYPDFTFQISITHPLEVHKAYHFRQSLDRRGLFLTSKLSSPVRGSDTFPRPLLWSRHINGNCLLCHPECRGGCWGPKSAQCRRCLHYRVWHSGILDKESEIWSSPIDPSIKYMLNKDASTSLTYRSSNSDQKQKPLENSMHFTCESICPAEMPFTSYDPLTGDITCHSSSDLGSNSVYIERQRTDSVAESRNLGAGFVMPLAIVFIICLLCITLTCLFRRHRRGQLKSGLINKPKKLNFTRFFDKVLHLYEEPKSSQPYRIVSYIAGSGSTVATSESNGLLGSGGTRESGLYGTSNRITWSSSEGSACKFCRGSIADCAKSQQSTLIYRSSYSYNPIYRRSTRQQPNMGRLVLINLDDIQLPANKVALGSGAFGAVYKGIWRIPDDIEDVQVPTFECPDHRRHVNVAVKILNEQNGPSNMQALLEEAKVMCSVRHRNCLQLLGVCLAGSQRYLVSEYIPNGSLDGFIRRSRNDIPHWLLLLWADQIADGMAYLQSAGIIHRDLATRNVLVKERDWVQITDFGLAKMLSGEEEESGEVIVRSGRVPIRWLAIETLTSGRYSFKTDVWAYGVTLWEIFTFGQRPYPTIETKDVKRYVVTGGRLPQPDICTLESYQRLLLACWRENPEERISFTDVLQLLRSKANTPEYFLHSRPGSSVISTNTTRTTRLSGANSESGTRCQRDSASSPPGGSINAPLSTSSLLSTAVRQQNNCHRFIDGLPPRAPSNHSMLLRGGPQQQRQQPLQNQQEVEEESMPTTVEYTTTSNNTGSGDCGSENCAMENEVGTSGEVTLVLPTSNNENQLPNNGSGGYVWPLPISECISGGGGGEYVGPLFRNLNEVGDM
ncbi:hypothetical protein Aperf_G00000083560 [Anoplocephala perfoliata]